MVLQAPNNQTVSQPLTLQCNISTVRGITSRMDIVWRSNGIELKRIKEAVANSTHDDTEFYADIYGIPLLSTTDEYRVIQCEMVIMTTPSIVVADDVTLDINGKYIATCFVIGNKSNTSITVVLTTNQKGRFCYNSYVVTMKF